MSAHTSKFAITIHGVVEAASQAHAEEVANFHLAADALPPGDYTGVDVVQVQREEGARQYAGRLHAVGTYEATVRLKHLRQERTHLQADDVAALFEVYLEGAADAGTAPSMADFGHWVSASDGYDGCKPAEVVW